ncbi:MAG TPA: 50S ribosomal protein L19 [Planctomycetota bacterium]|jgi:large subunit ribosomal protein L19|nr:50S ribosomal protein L19 [Planctomycetota bacterium]
MDFISQLETPLLKKGAPTFRVGDTVDVHYRIFEGDKERVQVFTGTVIAFKGQGIRRSFIVRRLVQGEGVERTFPLHSPRVSDVLVRRRGEVRRAKLFYLRKRVGKATKVKEKLTPGAARVAGEPASPAPEPAQREPAAAVRAR